MKNCFLKLILISSKMILMKSTQLSTMQIEELFDLSDQNKYSK